MLSGENYTILWKEFFGPEIKRVRENWEKLGLNFKIPQISEEEPGSRLKLDPETVHRYYLTFGTRLLPKLINRESILLTDNESSRELPYNDIRKLYKAEENTIPSAEEIRNSPVFFFFADHVWA
ncbi:MAG: hypothetical protein KatS3mg090_0551 [Patescibacteria group bacterium]|nr:MAG: hypothetical protein KatS3mg090_0551 [Patescibacteria group bacterium]